MILIAQASFLKAMQRNLFCAISVDNAKQMCAKFK